MELHYGFELRTVTVNTPFKKAGLDIKSRSSDKRDALIDRPDLLSLCSGEVSFG